MKPFLSFRISEIHEFKIYNFLSRFIVGFSLFDGGVAQQPPWCFFRRKNIWMFTVVEVKIAFAGNILETSSLFPTLKNRWISFQISFPDGFRSEPAAFTFFKNRAPARSISNNC